MHTNTIKKGPSQLVFLVEFVLELVVVSARRLCDGLSWRLRARCIEKVRIVSVRNAIEQILGHLGGILRPKLVVRIRFELSELFQRFSVSETA